MAEQARPSSDTDLNAQALHLEKDLSGIRRAMRRPLDAEVAKGELTAPQTAVMREVVRHEGVSLRDLSRVVSLAHSTVSGIVDRLEKRGFIERRPDPRDGRVSCIYPTSPVREFVRERLPALNRGPLLEALARATPEERAGIAAALHRLRELLDNSSQIPLDPSPTPQGSRMPAVAFTSRWTAAIRARESQRADRLFEDKFATALAGPEGAFGLEASEKSNPRHEYTANFIAIRVRFLDDLALNLVSEGIRQIVIPAAGMDARAFRLAWPAGTTVYEIDHPDLLELKEQILERECADTTCRRVTVPSDLREDWKSRLIDSGFRKDEKSLWLVEGLLYYLAEETVHDFLSKVSSLAASGSVLGADLASASTLTSPWMQPSLKQMEKSGFPWKFGSDDPEGLFAQYGWSTIARQVGEEGANFGRWTSTVFPRSETAVPRTFLVEARKN